MSTPAEDALMLQRPLQNGALKIVATGQKKDDEMRTDDPIALVECDKRNLLEND